MIKSVDIEKEECTPCTSKRNKKLIYKLIEHTVYNLPSSMNEAYSEGTLKKFIQKFKDEAEDLNINVTDQDLENYIKNFDKGKEKLPPDQRDLDKWSISKLIKFATASPGDEAPEAIDITPDVVYHNDDDSIAVYNGSKEGNCIRFGKGEKWCITRGSYANYRYSSQRGYPTFYLARNTNLPDSRKLSFVAIQVRNPETEDVDERYVYTNRENSPNESEPMSLDRLEREVPWLREIPNLENVLKYIPLSTGEKVTQQYKNNPVSYSEWTKLPFSVKKQYLVVRKDVRERGGNERIFSDIDDKDFVENHLAKYPEILNFVATTPGVIKPTILIRALEKFPDSARRSIMANFFEDVDQKYLASSFLPFNVKKLLVKLGKYELKPDERLYVAKDGDTIVKLTFEDPLKIQLYQEDDNYPNVKLTKRTSKYLLDYPELEKVPFKTFVDLVKDGAISNDIIKKLVEKIKEKPGESGITVKPVDDGDIILDSSSLTSFKMDKEGNVTQVPFNDEEVQQAFDDSIDNETFQKNVLNIFRTNKDIPATVDKDALLNVVESIPYGNRTFGEGEDRVVLLSTPQGERNFFFMRINPTSGRAYTISPALFGRGRDWRRYDTQENLDRSMYPAYFNYLRQSGNLIDDDLLVNILSSGAYDSLYNFAASNPPVNPQNRYKLAVDGDRVLLIDPQNPRNTRKPSTRGGLVQAPISATKANQLLGVQAPQQQPTQQQQPQQQGVTRAYWQQPAPVGNISVGDKMTELGAAVQFNRLPDRDRRRLNIDNAAPLNRLTDGGARRRNQLLGTAGIVTDAIAVGQSRMYIIRLRNGQTVISIKVYPGNREYLLIPGQAALQLNEPGDLITALRQRNLAEAKKYLIRSYLDTNPANLEEFKQILRKHINKKHE